MAGDPSSSGAIATLSSPALVGYSRGDVEGALPSCHEVLDAFEAANGARHLRTGQAHDDVGGCLMDLRRWDEAESHAGHDILSDVQGPLGVRLQRVVDRLVDLHASYGNPESAVEWHRKSKP
jgi:hypothetical protein